MQALVNRIQQRPPIELRRLFDFVRDDVLTSPNGMVVIADLPDGGGVAVVKVWKTADGKFGGGWGPIRSVIPATIERANP